MKISLLLIILVFLRPFMGSISEPSSNWFFLLILLFILLLHLIRSITKNTPSYSTTLDPLFFLFFFSLIIGLATSFSKNEAKDTFFIFFSYLLLFFLTINYPPPLKKARFFIILGGFILSLYGIYQFLWGFKETQEFITLYNLHPSFLERISSKRVFSTFIYPNAFAGYLILIIPLLFSLKKRFFIISIPILCALYLTGSRGGFISLFFLLLLFFLLKKKRFLIIISLSLFLLSIIYYCIPPPSSLVARAGYARTAIKIIKDNPAGTGLSSFKDMYFKYKLPHDEETRLAHNNYLQIGVELGILGLILFLLIVIFIIKDGLFLVRKNPDLEPYYICCLGAFFHFLGEFTLYLPEITSCLFFFIGLLFSSERKERYLNKIFCSLFIIPILILSIYCIKMIKACKAYEKAITYIFTNEDRLACEKLEEAIRLNKNPEWLILLGKIKEKEDINASLNLYKEAQKQNPYCAYYNFCVGKALIKIGREKEAISFLKMAHSLYPTNPSYKIE